MSIWLCHLHWRSSDGLLGVEGIELVGPVDLNVSYILARDRYVEILVAVFGRHDDGCGDGCSAGRLWERRRGWRKM